MSNLDGLERNNHLSEDKILKLIKESNLLFVQNFLFICIETTFSDSTLAHPCSFSGLI